MPPNPNDALWDPRPRLEREAEHVDETGTPAAPGGRRTRPGGEQVPGPGAVLVELVPSAGMSAAAALDVGRRLARPGFALDEEFGAMPLTSESGEQTFLVRGRVSGEAVVAELEGDSRVLKVWRDTPVAPF
ncbi:MAG TPA: hypothetical protein VFB26_11240 [Gaiellaceae bacterium]|nr:hypothetical protein [Gaiellaceae bacterium]